MMFSRLVGCYPIVIRALQTEHLPPTLLRQTLSPALIEKKLIDKAVVPVERPKPFLKSKIDHMAQNNACEIQRAEAFG